MDPTDKTPTPSLTDIDHCAVENEGEVLKDIPEPSRTAELCLTAVQSDGNALAHVPGDQKMPDLCLAALGNDGYAFEDEKYDEAVSIVLKNKKASISMVQRHLRIGFNRVARLLEQMERNGLVSPMKNNGIRDLIVPINQDTP